MKEEEMKKRFFSIDFRVQKIDNDDMRCLVLVMEHKMDIPAENELYTIVLVVHKSHNSPM